MYSRPLYKINAGDNTWGFIFSKIFSFFSFFLSCIFSASCNEISGMLLSLGLQKF